MRTIKGFGIFAIIFACIVLLVGCSQNVDQKQEFGTLVIEIDTAIERGLQAVSMETDSYNVTVKNASDETIFTTTKTNKTSFTISVPVGSCSVEIEALNKAGDIIGTGTASGTVDAKTTTTFNVLVQELKGNGNFSISISGPSGNELVYYIKSTDGTLLKSGNLTYSNGIYSSSIELPNGFYLFSIQWPETNKTIEIDTIRVIKGKTSVYDAEFLFLVDGSISIVNEIVETPTIKLTSNSKALSGSKTLQVKADVQGLVDYTCSWYVDNVAVENSNSSTLELPMSSYEEGEHTAKIIVSTASVVWSESIGFVVLPDRPTTLEVSGPFELHLAGDVLIPYSLTVTCRLSSIDNSYTLSGSGTLTRSLNVSGTHVLSCELSNENFIYYLESAYDDARGVNIVYVVIDRYIEDSSTVNITFNLKDEDLADSNYGLFLMANQKAIDETDHSSGRNTWGLVPYDPIRPSTIKVAPDTYTINADWWSPNKWFYVEEDESSFTISTDGVKTLTLNQGDPVVAKILISDNYDAETSFYVYDMNWGGMQFGYVLKDGGITMKTCPNRDIDCFFFSEKDKDYYYTASVGKSIPGEYSVEAVKHSSEFIDTGIDLNGGTYTVIFDYDCLIPYYLYIQFRSGDRYSSLYGARNLWQGNKSISLDSGDFEIWSCNSEGLNISATIEGNVITVKITMDDYATFNVINDFDNAIISSSSSAVTFYDSRKGIDYILPIVAGSKTAFKAAPGTYSGTGWYNWISYNSNRFRPQATISTSNVKAGDTVDVSVRMIQMN